MYGMLLTTLIVGVGICFLGLLLEVFLETKGLSEGWAIFVGVASMVGLAFIAAHLLALGYVKMFKP